MVKVNTIIHYTPIKANSSLLARLVRTKLLATWNWKKRWLFYQ